MNESKLLSEEEGQSREYTFTVFTPTYNLARTLPRLYESLEGQTFRDFEWIIIDDESSDDTEHVIRGLTSSATFPIRYHRQKNSGKHVSSNRAADLARGKLFGTVDADDWYAFNALERFLHHWRAIPSDVRDDYVGVVGLCTDPDGNLIGDRFPSPVLDSDYLEMQVTYGVQGDKAGVGRTDVIQAFKFPEDEHGGWVSEALVYNRIAQRYRARFVNEVLMFKEYQVGGMSASGGIARAKSPRAARTYYAEAISFRRRMSPRLLLRHHANLIRYSLHAKERPRVARRASASIRWWALALAPGLGLYVRDRLRLRSLSQRET